MEERARHDNQDGCNLEDEHVPKASNVVRPRLIIDSRKKAADLVRTFPKTSSESYLRAVFVLEDSTYFGSTILAVGEKDILELNYLRILDQAFRLGAAAFLLVRGLPTATKGLSKDEVAKALQLYRFGERASLFLIDYIVIEDETEKGLLLVHPADRISIVD